MLGDGASLTPSLCCPPPCVPTRSILLYEMLCGVPPFRAKSRQALQQQITSGKVKYPSE